MTSLYGTLDFAVVVDSFFPRRKRGGGGGFHDSSFPVVDNASLDVFIVLDFSFLCPVVFSAASVFFSRDPTDSARPKELRVCGLNWRWFLRPLRANKRRGFLLD